MRRLFPSVALSVLALLLLGSGCGVEKPSVSSADQKPAAPPTLYGERSRTIATEPAPAPDKTGGFDGARAYAHVAKLVEIGPRQPGSEGIRKAREYIRGQLTSFGCAVEDDDFQVTTPAGRVAMKNIVAKIPGSSPNMVLLLTHYDTYRLAGFVGANDSGSSTGVMLELARLLCGKQHGLSPAQPRDQTIWMAFLDGEEAFVQWSETDGTYGSRQLAAKMALAGDLKRVKAVILADMVGYRELRFRRETNSTPWLVNLIWDTARRLGYGEQFLDETTAVEDDHTPFLRRGVPAVDLIQLDDYPYWHTAQDTLDKISPRSLAITGHVILEVLPQIEKRSR